MSKGNFGDDVLKIGGFQYLHVLDTNTNTIQVVVGPKTFTRLEHERGMLNSLRLRMTLKISFLFLYSSFKYSVLVLLRTQIEFLELTVQQQICSWNF